ncbi:hypothetical protein MAPG_03390 [Magnaporthiopsis poae ATCC 64411]|uniref:Uncharacterized protein n=1 Tax=Magnaporthiopsis poae (strain ATCC 64411 / 73-15) TaxID=644358 RepID=A0A0C4DTW3_MAGP6|nr:hypothetical protein MAPG_03390 [Magnaporthiopsis poae ATCC 64411]
MPAARNVPSDPELPMSLASLESELHLMRLSDATRSPFPQQHESEMAAALLSRRDAPTVAAAAQDEPGRCGDHRLMDDDLRGKKGDEKSDVDENKPDNGGKPDEDGDNSNKPEEPSD